MPPKQQTSSCSAQGPSQKAIAAGVMDVLKGLLSELPKPRKRGNPAKKSGRKRQKGKYQIQAMPANMPSQVYRGFAGMSDMHDFTLAYNAADVVLGGATVNTAPGSLGIAYWLPRQNSADRKSVV